MEAILEFIVANYETIGLIIVGILGLLWVGRNRAMSIVAKIAAEGRDHLADDIRINHEKYAEYVHSKLPLNVKIFLSKGLIDKIILEFADTIDTDLDKS